MPARSADRSTRQTSDEIVVFLDQSARRLLSATDRSIGVRSLTLSGERPRIRLTQACSALPPPTRTVLQEFRGHHRRSTVASLRPAALGSRVDASWGSGPMGSEPQARPDDTASASHGAASPTLGGVGDPAALTSIDG